MLRIVDSPNCFSISPFTQRPFSNRVRPPPFMPAQSTCLPSSSVVSNISNTVLSGMPLERSKMVHEPFCNLASPPPYVPNHIALPAGSSVSKILKTEFTGRPLRVEKLRQPPSDKRARPPPSVPIQRVSVPFWPGLGNKLNTLFEDKPSRVPKTVQVP